jgi:beta-glucosidase
VPIPLGELNATDLRPFEAAIAAGVASIMTAHVAYPAWDSSGLPATQSATILGYLRSSLGFDGLVVTDALIMEGARAGRAEGEAVICALRAGCDVLLYPGNLETVIGALRRSAEEDQATATRVADALARYEHALSRVAVEAGSAALAELPPHSADQIADRLLAQGFLRGQAPSFAGGITLQVIDDDQGGWYAPGPNDLVVRRLARRRIFEQAGGAMVVLAFAEPRAAKGRAGFGPESRARFDALLPHAAMVVLFGHPRLAEGIPGSCPILCAWHRQPLMQEAVARWLEWRVKAESGG